MFLLPLSADLSRGVVIGYDARHRSTSLRRSRQRFFGLVGWFIFGINPVQPPRARFGFVD